MKQYLRATFESLDNRNFRLFFTGQTISVMGTWMQKVAQALLVLELTGSGTLLGITAALQHLPILLITPWGGLLADRADKRRILLWTQSSAAVPAVLLGVLTATEHITLWMVLVLALVLGIIEALDKPARHTFVIEMVGSGQVTNAVTLNSLVMNVGKVGGPAIAGVLINAVGLALTFVLNAVSFTAVVLGLLLMQADQLDRATPTRRSPGQLRQGFRYVRQEPGLLGPLVLMTVTGMLAYEWTVTIPLFAYETFDGDAQVVGFMFAAMGAGAVVGGLAVAGSFAATANRLITTGLIFSVLLLLAAAAPTVAFAYVLLMLVGVASIAFRAVATALVQLRADPQMRGRAMALLVVAIGGTTPFGGPLLGWIAETYGARTTLGIGAIGTAIAAGATLIYLRGSAGPRPARGGGRRAGGHHQGDRRPDPAGLA